MKEKTDKPPGSAGSHPPDSDEPGRFGLDDRGNVTWQWADHESLQADDTLGAAERVRALVDPSLDILEDDNPGRTASNSKGLVKGYNPYDSGVLGKDSRKKKKDLRELSKWIELRKKLAPGQDPK